MNRKTSHQASDAENTPAPSRDAVQELLDAAAESRQLVKRIQQAQDDEQRPVLGRARQPRAPRR